MEYILQGALRDVTYMEYILQGALHNITPCLHLFVRWVLLVVQVHGSDAELVQLRQSLRQNDGTGHTLPVKVQIKHSQGMETRGQSG